MSVIIFIISSFSINISLSTTTLIISFSYIIFISGISTWVFISISIIISISFSFSISFLLPASYQGLCFLLFLCFPFENEKTPCSCGFARFCEVKCEAVEPPSAPVLLSRPMKTARAFLSGRVFVRAIFFELRALASPNALLLLPV